MALSQYAVFNNCAIFKSRLRILNNGRWAALYRSIYDVQIIDEIIKLNGGNPNIGRIDMRSKHD